MTMIKLMEKINSALAGESLIYEDVELFLDEVIDDINERLNSKFPVFSDNPIRLQYNYFPDRYIRSVVIPGTVFKFYTCDEEGIGTAQTYGAQYDRGLFLMQRDYLDLVPLAYQEDPAVGAVTVPTDFAYPSEVPAYTAYLDPVLITGITSLLQEIESANTLYGIALEDLPTTAAVNTKAYVLSTGTDYIQYVYAPDGWHKVTS